MIMLAKSAGMRNPETNPKKKIQHQSTKRGLRIKTVDRDELGFPIFSGLKFFPSH